MNDVFIFIHHYNDFSGSPKVFRQFINSSVFKKKKKILLTSNHKGFLDDIDSEKEYLYYRLGSKKYFTVFFYFFYQIILFFYLLFKLFFLKVNGHNPIVIVNTMLPFSAGLACKVLHVNITYYIHETYIKPLLLKKVIRFFIELTADNVIFVSHYLSKEEAFIKPRQCVVHNCVDYASIDIDFDLKYSKKNIIFVGSLRKYKGIDNFVKLAMRLSDFNFLMVLNSNQVDFDCYFHKSVLPKNITVYFRPENLSELYRDSFLCVNLTIPEMCVETFGLTLIEAMRFYCPVIAPPCGGPVEIVHSGNGFLIHSGRIDELSFLIESVYENYFEWLDLAKNAYETSLNFTAEKYSDDIKKCLESFYFFH